MNEEKGRLEPARYDESADEGFAAPTAPWKIAVVVVGVLAFLIVGYQVRKQMRLAELRDSLQAAYQQRVFPSVASVAAFRGRIDGWVVEAARSPVQETLVADGFTIGDLRDVPGVYLRISEEEAASLATIDTAAKNLTPDAIGRCLGIAPMAIRPLYDKSDFLQAAWIDRVRDIDDVLKLRVIEDELALHAERDLPVLEELVQSRYFMLLLVRGQTRSSHPVDVYVWSLEGAEPQLLLQTRTRAMGTLISARNAVGGARGRALPADAPRFSGASDCSIASQIRAAVEGEPPLTVQSVQPGADTPTRVPGDASAAPGAGAEVASGAASGADALPPAQE